MHVTAELEALFLLSQLVQYKMRCPYLVVVCCITQQASEGDGIGNAAQVDEEHSRDRLDVETLIKITRQPWQFPLYVQIQTTTETDVHRQMGYSG